MANKPTIIDIHRADSSDAGQRVAAVLEEVAMRVPELATFPITRVNGTKLSMQVRTSVPRAEFVPLNGGPPVRKSTYTTKEVQLMNMEAVARVADNLLRATPSEIRGRLMTDAQVGQSLGTAISLARQLWYGTEYNKDGFFGIAELIDSLFIKSANPNVSVPGSSGTTSAFLVNHSREGVELLQGDGLFTMTPYEKAKWTYTDEDTNETREVKGFTSDLGGFAGVTAWSMFSAARIANISNTNPLTDALVDEVVNNFPVGHGPTHIYMSRKALMTLRKSRSVVVLGNTATGKTSATAPIPEEVGGLKIVVTDAIFSDESKIAEYAKVKEYKADEYNK